MPSALAYGPDGSLYVVQGGYFNYNNNPPYPVYADTLDVIKNGLVTAVPLTAAPLLPDQTSQPFPGFVYVGGAAWDGNNTLLATDNFDSGLYSINVSTGVVTTLFDYTSSDPTTQTAAATIESVAVRFNGDIFINDAAGQSQGGVFVYNPTAQTVTQIATPGVSFDYGGGLAFNGNNLILQTSDYPTGSGIYSLPISPGTSGINTVLGTATTLATGAPAYGVAVGTNNDFFATGNGGLVRGDSLTGSANITSIESDGTPYQFSTALAFMPGTGIFQAYGSPSSGTLAYLPEYSSTAVTFITPSPVPEPSALVLMAGGAAFLWVAGRRWRRATGGR